MSFRRQRTAGRRMRSDTAYHGSHGYIRSGRLCIHCQCSGHGNYPETQVIENPKIKVEGIEDEALKINGNIM